MPDYQQIADRLAADIVAGRIRPGERLAPQRQFAREHGIASSTATRVYAELIRRGLAVGEVGRGTFARAAEQGTQPALAEPSTARVDLELNFSVLPEQPDLLSASLRRMLRPDLLRGALGPIGVAGDHQAREAASASLARAGWVPDSRRVLFAGNGRQAIAAAISALVPSGERLGVERLTYPLVKGIAARLGVTLVPLAMDEHGLIPEALSTGPPLRAVYLQPVLHNPLGSTMPGARRVELTESLRRMGVYAIEDAIYGYLRDDLAPLAALAPERVVVVDSLSKRLAPGLTLGFLITPADIQAPIAAALRSGTWMASCFAVAIATRWALDGAVGAIEHRKRRDAMARQRIVAEHLAGFSVHADPHAYHCWWELPEPWRAETFVAAAARHGIAVTPAAAFTVGAGHAPNAVRLALGSPPIEVLADSLDLLARLADGALEDVGWE